MAQYGIVLLVFGAPKRPVYVNFRCKNKIISRQNYVNLRGQFLQKFLEAHRLPEFSIVAVLFVLVVVEIIMAHIIMGVGE